MRVCMDKSEENEKPSTKGPSTKYDHFMRVTIDKHEEYEKPSTKGSSTKYYHFMRVSMEKNEENEKSCPLKISILISLMRICKDFFF